MNIKRFLAATKKTLLLLAIAHFVILAFLTISTQNIIYLNVFSVLDIQEFFPGIETGRVSAVVSFTIMSVIYLLFYIRSKR